MSAGGLLTLGLLCPVGLGLGLAALGKRPRGFAVGGVAVGLAGTLLAALWGAGVAKRLLDEVNASRSTVTLVEAMHRIELQRPKLGRRPTRTEGQEAIADLEDAWGRAYRYLELDGSYYGTGEYYRLGSAGPDGKFDTKDDIAITGSISNPMTLGGR